MLTERGEMVMVAYALFAEEVNNAVKCEGNPLSPEQLRTFIGYFRSKFPKEYELLLHHSLSFEDPEIHEDLEGEQQPVFRVLIREADVASSFIQTYAAPN